MSRLWLIFLGPIAIGVLIFASGIGHLGMCADESGSIAALLILAGLCGEIVLLTIAGGRAGWRRWKHSRTQSL